MIERSCQWCGGPLPEGSRRSRTTCSTSCQRALRRAHDLGRLSPVEVAREQERLEIAGRAIWQDLRVLAQAAIERWQDAYARWVSSLAAHDEREAAAAAYQALAGEASARDALTELAAFTAEALEGSA